MKQLSSLLIVGLFVFGANDIHAQLEFKTNSITVIGDDGSITLTYTGTGTSSLDLSSAGFSALPAGSSAGQLLVWDGDSWEAATNISYSGSDLTLTTGNFVGNGSQLTSLTPSNISTAGGSDGQALVHNGSEVAFEDVILPEDIVTGEVHVYASSQDFTLAHTPLAGTTRVYLNGIRQFPSDYTVVGTTLTIINPALSPGDALIVDYFK